MCQIKGSGASWQGHLYRSMIRVNSGWNTVSPLFNSEAEVRPAGKINLGKVW